MNKKALLQALQTYGDAQTVRQGIEKRLSFPRFGKKTHRLSVLAAILAVVLSLGCAAEARQYRQAVEFFEEHSLSTEGLTRKQIKAVYKDITLQAYSCEATAWVLNRLSVELFNVPLPQADPDRLAAFWQNYVAAAPVFPTGLHYRVEYEGDVPSVSRYDGDQRLWTYTPPFETYIFVDENLVETEHGVLIYGQNCDRLRGMALMLDANGRLLWQHLSEEAYSSYEAAVVNGEEVVLFGKKRERRPDENGHISGNTYSLLFMRLNPDGEAAEACSTLMGDYFTVHDAAKVGTRYLVKQGVQEEDGFSSQLIFLSQNGTQESRLEYTDGEQRYRICDLLVYNRQVYVSAELLTHSDSDFEALFTRLFEPQLGHWDGQAKPNPRLAELFASQSTATLLVCNENGTAHKAYSVPRARAGSLQEREDGLLSWQIFRIDSVYPAPAYLSSRRVDIQATEFEMLFNELSELVRRNERGPYTLTY